eukprot:TRINITY_DN2037_c0_g2_i1.p1 TRINITY_DN2037_c0_g2~~TRINITY_DN2037_c0_g2_i1.p1  ORF type:complete len:1050 (-),score=164.06 TRINITY_DN2037_c0_g2_i1:50-3199(-)
MQPLPFLPGDYPSLRVYTPTDKIDECLKQDIRSDIYKEQFFPNDHYNFIGDESSNEHVIISVLSQGTKRGSTQVHRGLVTTKKGYEEFELNLPEASLFSTDSITQRMEKALKKDLSQFSNIYFVSNPQFRSDILRVEEKHSQKRRVMKIGLVYSKKGQVSPQEMFLNKINKDNPSDAKFLKFLDILGYEIDLDNWTGYRGDMKSPGKTYFTNWKDVEVIFHVAPYLDAEGHRRLIGNDIAVLFYLEEGQDSFLNLTNISQMGTVPQIFVVVQPVGEEYRVGFFEYANIKKQDANPPKALLDVSLMKDVILTKLYNGLVIANYCPPMNRLFYVPRKDTIESIVVNYPKSAQSQSSNILMNMNPAAAISNAAARLGVDKLGIRSPTSSPSNNANTATQSPLKRLNPMSLVRGVSEKKMSPNITSGGGGGGSTTSDTTTTSSEEKEKTSKPLTNIDDPWQNTVLTFENDSQTYSSINSFVLLISSNLAQQDTKSMTNLVSTQLGFPVNSVETFEDKELDVRGFLSYDKEKIFISFGGTIGMKNIGPSLVLESRGVVSSLPNWNSELFTSVHRGFATATLTIWDIVQPIFSRIYKGQKVWVSGYSFGGSVAHLVGYLIQHAGNEVSGIYTYGTPKIGDTPFSEAYNAILKDKTYRVVNSGDFVPRIQPRTMGWRTIGTMYYIHSDGSIQPDVKLTLPSGKSIKNATNLAHLASSYYNVLFPHHKRAVESQTNQTPRLSSSSNRASTVESGDDGKISAKRGRRQAAVSRNATKSHDNSESSTNAETEDDAMSELQDIEMSLKTHMSTHLTPRNPAPSMPNSINTTTQIDSLTNDLLELEQDFNSSFSMTPSSNSTSIVTSPSYEEFDLESFGLTEEYMNDLNDLCNDLESISSDSSLVMEPVLSTKTENNNTIIDNTSINDDYEISGSIDLHVIKSSQIDYQFSQEMLIPSLDKACRQMGINLSNHSVFLQSNENDIDILPLTPGTSFQDLRINPKSALILTENKSYVSAKNGISVWQLLYNKIAELETEVEYQRTVRTELENKIKELQQEKNV